MNIPCKLKEKQNKLNHTKFKHFIGFTLFELIIVMTIMAIIAVIAVPSVASYQRSLRKKNCQKAMNLLAENIKNNVTTKRFENESAIKKEIVKMCVTSLGGAKVTIGAEANSGTVDTSTETNNSVTFYTASNIDELPNNFTEINLYNYCPNGGKYTVNITENNSTENNSAETNERPFNLNLTINCDCTNDKTVNKSLSIPKAATIDEKTAYNEKQYLYNNCKELIPAISDYVHDFIEEIEKEEKDKKNKETTTTNTSTSNTESSSSETKIIDENYNIGKIKIKDIKNRINEEIDDHFQNDYENIKVDDNNNNNNKDDDISYPSFKKYLTDDSYAGKEYGKSSDVYKIINSMGENEKYEIETIIGTIIFDNKKSIIEININEIYFSCSTGDGNDTKSYNFKKVDNNWELI